MARVLDKQKGWAVPIEKLFPKRKPLSPEMRIHITDLATQNLIDRFHVSETEARDFVESYLNAHKRSIKTAKVTRKLYEEVLANQNGRAS